MTGDGTCGVFIPEGVVVGKVAEPMGGRVRVSRTRTYIYLPLPQPAVTPPTPTGHSSSHWLRHFPTTTPSGTNTPHVPTQGILHPPAHEDGTDRGFLNVGF